jgi:hypothetical protein
MNTRVTDALGNEVVMGNEYGYASESSGRTRVVTGLASSVTKTGKISLVITSVNTYLYGELSNYKNDTAAPKVSVKGCSLFPINR